MLKLKTDKMEVRGVKDHLSNKGNTYYTLHCEDVGGEPFSFYCKSAEVFPSKLDKGDIVVITLTMDRYKNLIVDRIEK